jgi:S-adenosylmethionine:tRNA ribosyltransferase-isomerase
MVAAERAARGDETVLAPIDLGLYDFLLPPERIAQRPTPERDAARLLVLDRASGNREHATMRELPRFLRRGDLVVVNATQVVPAKLRGRKETGGVAEALVLGPGAVPNAFRALVGCRGRLRVGQRFVFARDDRSLVATITALRAHGEVELAFAPGESPYDVGEAPLPPYIRRAAPEAIDGERYQSVFARVPGSVAAPTASLHLSERLLASLADAGIERAEVVLHVGPGTFRPLGAEQLASGRLHAERYELPLETADAIARARARGGRIVAVGTTTTRVLESCARGDAPGLVAPGNGETTLFLRPGRRFAVIDALLTNFHLPRSSLLLLVAAFAGREAVLEAYADAVARGYRFFSYGDAMLVR